MIYVVKTSKGMSPVEIVAESGGKVTIRHLDTGKEETCTRRRLKEPVETTGGPMALPPVIKGMKINQARLIEKMLYRNDRNGRWQACRAMEAGCTTFISVYRWVMGEFVTRRSLRDTPPAFRRGFAAIVAEEFARVKPDPQGRLF